MHIFVLHQDPGVAATYLCDGHVIKMTLETAQILSTVARRLNLSTEPSLYRPTHERHPCVQWAGSNAQNYWWLLQHFQELCSQYSRRYRKTHKCESLARHFQAASQEFFRVRNDLRTTFALAMPDRYKVETNRQDLRVAAAVWSYRNYYWNEKIGKIKLDTYYQRPYPTRMGGSRWGDDFLRFARRVQVMESPPLGLSRSETPLEDLQVTTRSVLMVTSDTFNSVRQLWVPA